jgi:tRNA threonylcarbamoyladenosine biosynthesis protein TsaE
MASLFSRQFLLTGAAATEALAQALAPVLSRGDVLALWGEIGAGKSHFCRALITARLAAVGRAEDIPSPTYTLVQTYDAGDLQIWHTDLYRLGGPDDVLELGLDEAFETALSLIEWPDRLGEDLPRDALHLHLDPGASAEDRRATLSSHGDAWPDRLAGALDGFEAAHA